LLKTRIDGREDCNEKVVRRFMAVTSVYIRGRKTQLWFAEGLRLSGKYVEK
jgi:hypothetical protein